MGVDRMSDDFFTRTLGQCVVPRFWTRPALSPSVCNHSNPWVSLTLDQWLFLVSKIPANCFVDSRLRGGTNLGVVFSEGGSQFDHRWMTSAFVKKNHMLHGHSFARLNGGCIMQVPRWDTVDDLIEGTIRGGPTLAPVSVPTGQEERQGAPVAWTTSKITTDWRNR